MAGTIDIIIQKEALAELDKAIAKIGQLQAGIIETSKIARTNQPNISTPSGLSSSTANNAAITAQIQAQKKSIQDLHVTSAKLIEQTRLAEIRLEQQREKSVDKYNAQLAKKSAAEEKAAAKAIAQSEKELARKEKEFSRFEQQFNKYEADLKKKEIAEQKASISAQKVAERERLYEIKNQLAREKAFDNYEKQLKKEAQKLEASQSLYNKVQLKLNELNKEYRDLAIKKELTGQLTDKEANRYDHLSKRISKYDTTLKAVDASMGKYSRNVGNYASGFNPISNSINQLTREMPAFANSAQTGFMAISNNLPIFFDAMKGAVDKNKELQAQGEPTESVLGQLAESIFSVGTALSVGVTLLTIYGDELVEWAAKAFGASKAIESLNNNQNDFNNAKIEGRKESIRDRTELDKYVQIMRNVNLTEEERAIAKDKIIKQFPFFFKGLKDEVLYNGDISKNLTAVNIALERNSVLKKAQDANIRNKETLVDLKEELRLNESLIVSNKREVEERNKIRISDNFETAKEQRRITSYITAKYNDALAKRITLQSEINKFEEAIKKNRETEILLAGQTIGLEFQEDKQRNKKKKDLNDLNLEMSDYLSSRYELIKLEKEIAANNFDETFKNESATLKQRIEAYNNYVNKKIELEEDALEESLRLNQLEVKDAIDSAVTEYNNFIRDEKATSSQKISAKQNLNSVLASIEKKGTIEVERIQLEHSNKIVEIKKDEVNKREQLIEDNIRGIETGRLNQQELDDLREHQNNLINITKNTSEKALNKIDKDRTENSLSNQKVRIQNDIFYLSDKLSREKEFTEAYIKLQDQIIAKQKELTNISITEADKQKQKREKDLADMANYKKSFLDEFTGNSGFSETFKILNKEITGFGDNFAVTFNAIAETAQETFNFISDASQRNFEAEYSRLESQKEIAIGFAGDSAAAKQQIEDQYEARRKDIANRENKAKQKQAIFNIAIDTAQAIIATLAKTPAPAGLPIAFAVGALGAIQIAAVASQKIPQYFEGGTHYGGLAMINDAKGSNYVETVVTPDGKAQQYSGRNVVTDLPAGTEIYTPEQWNDWQKQQLLPMLNSKGISGTPNIQIENKGITYQEMDQIIGKHFANIKTHSTVIDKKGFQSFVTNGNSKTIINNSRVTGSGLSV